MTEREPDEILEGMDELLKKVEPEKQDGELGVLARRHLKRETAPED